MVAGTANKDIHHSRATPHKVDTVAIPHNKAMAADIHPRDTEAGMAHHRVNMADIHPKDMEGGMDNSPRRKAD